MALTVYSQAGRAEMIQRGPCVRQRGNVTLIVLFTLPLLDWNPGQADRPVADVLPRPGTPHKLTGHSRPSHMRRLCRRGVSAQETQRREVGLSLVSDLGQGDGDEFAVRLCLREATGDIHAGVSVTDLGCQQHELWVYGDAALEGAAAACVW